MKCPKCERKGEFLYTLEDWYNGDETDVYKCKEHGVFRVYIPR